MRVFELKAVDWLDVTGEASSKWGLPGVHCPACGETWGNVSVAYPTVSLADLKDRAPYENREPVPWERLTELRAAIKHLVPRGQPLPPGTGLGPLVGEYHGAVRDLMWPYPWTLLCTPSALLRLRTAGLLSLKGAVSELRLCRVDEEQSFELEIEAHGELAASCRSEYQSACGVCGREDISRPTQVVLNRDSLPKTSTIFRLRELTTAVFAPEPVVETLARLRLQGWRAEEVELD